MAFCNLAILLLAGEASAFYIPEDISILRYTDKRQNQMDVPPPSNNGSDIPIIWVSTSKANRSNPYLRYVIQGSVLSAAIGCLIVLGIISCIKDGYMASASASVPGPPPYMRSNSRQNPEDGPPLPMYKERPDQSDQVLETCVQNPIEPIVHSYK